MIRAPAVGVPVTATAAMDDMARNYLSPIHGDLTGPLRLSGFLSCAEHASAPASASILGAAADTTPGGASDRRLLPGRRRGVLPCGTHSLN
jgi:hypothetical protein